MAGCGPAEPPAGAAPPALETVPRENVAAAGLHSRSGEPRGDLGALARKAMAESRIHSPAGDSAIDHYLALRERTPDDAGVAAALAELSPYMVIAAEQAIGQGDVYEADRLLELLRRMDAGMPALPRLRGTLQALHQARQAEMERAARAPQLTAATALAADSKRAAAATPVRVAALPPSVPRAAPDTGVASAPSAPPRTTPKPPPIPRLITDAVPRYPLSALRRGIEGRVRVAFTIEPDGSVSAPRLVSASPAGVFDEAAIAAAKRWRFEPGATAVNTSRVLDFYLPEG